MSRAPKKPREGQAAAPASSSPAEVANTSAPAHEPAEVVVEKLSSDAVTAAVPVETAPGGDDAPPSTGDGSRAVANPALAAAAREALQRRARSAFEADAADPGNGEGRFVLRVAPRLSIWRGGRYFTAGMVERLTFGDLSADQLRQVLGEPAFTCTFELSE